MRCGRLTTNTIGEVEGASRQTVSSWCAKSLVVWIDSVVGEEVLVGREAEHLDVVQDSRCSIEVGVQRAVCSKSEDVGKMLL